MGLITDGKLPSTNFTRSTSENEIDQFNQWMRSQPWWQDIAAQSGGKWDDRARSRLRTHLAQEGIVLPKDFDIDGGGNFNQKSRLKRNLGIAGLIAGGIIAANPGILGGAAAGSTGATTAAGTAGATAAGGAGATATSAPELIAGGGFGGGIIGGGGAASGGKGFWGKVGGGFKKVLGVGGDKDENPWGDLSKVLGASSQADASNRFTQAQLDQRADALKLDAAKEQRAAEWDAMKKLGSTSYILNGGAPKMNFQVRSGTMPDFGVHPPPISDAERQGAASLQSMVMNRLTPEGMLKITDPAKFSEKSAKEKATDWGALFTAGLGTARKIWS